MSEASLTTDIERQLGVGAVRDLLDRNGIDPAEIGKVAKIKLYQGQGKVVKLDEEGNEYSEMQVTDMAAVELWPGWENGPEWPVIQPGPAHKVPKVQARKGSKHGLKKCVVFPDIQAGYWQAADGTLVSTHDDRAVDLALAMTKDVDPDLVVLVGDNADLPQMGKYRLSPAFLNTMQPTIDWLTTFAARLRAAAPNARIVWLAGNHEERMVNYLLDNAMAAFGLRQGNTAPTAWPVLSIPHLCRLDEVGVEYLPGYPANKFWINERLEVIHGDRVKSGGSTAHVYLNQRKSSVIYGHIHRVEFAMRRFEKWEGPRTIMAATPGCLAKVEGSVPSTKGGIDLHGRPLTVVEDWQQGIAVVTYDDTTDHQFHYNQVPFYGYTALLNDRLYEA